MLHDMKTLLNLLIIVTIVLSSHSSLAQFQVASQTDIAMSTGGANCRQTGNDFLLNGTDKIEVSVWDAGNGSSAFGYRINAGSQTLVPLSSSNGFDPDVCLIKDSNGDVHAIAVYYDATGNDYLLDVFDLSGTTFSLQSGCPYNIFPNVTFGTAVNVDSDDSFNFMVIWDEVTSNRLYAIAGEHSGTTINFINTPIAIGTSPGLGIFPDVCLFGNGSNRVTYTYISSGALYVESDDVSTIAGGGTSASILLTDNTPLNSYYEWPRISCPPTSNGSSTDWTVVYMDTDGSSNFEIAGYTENGGLNGPNYYTNGSPNPGLINTYNNYMPVVSYDNHNPYGIYVGWMHENPSSPGSSLSIVGTLPVVLQCDDIGAVVGSNYLEVSTSPTNNDFDIGLSLSGKNGNDWLFMTWEKDLSNDIFTKSISGISSASSLKAQLNELILPKELIDFENIESIQIFNILGNVIFSSTNIDAIHTQNMSEYLRQFSNGFFVLNIIYKNGQSKSLKSLNLLDLVVDFEV